MPISFWTREPGSTTCQRKRQSRFCSDVVITREGRRSNQWGSKWTSERLNAGINQSIQQSTNRSAWKLITDIISRITTSSDEMRYDAMLYNRANISIVDSFQNLLDRFSFDKTQKLGQPKLLHRDCCFCAGMCCCYAIRVTSSRISVSLHALPTLRSIQLYGESLRIAEKYHMYTFSRLCTHSRLNHYSDLGYSRL